RLPLAVCAPPPPEIHPPPLHDALPISDEIDSSPFRPTATAVAAREIHALRPGEVAQVDGETDTFPAPFSTLPPGAYRFQAVLDRDRKSTRLNSSHVKISYAVFCLKTKR